MSASDDFLMGECLHYTMLSPDRLRLNLQLMRRLDGLQLLPEGDILECGVWKGGMALAMTGAFGSSRRYRFYDSFEGMPAPSADDGEDARHWSTHPEHPRYFENCKADFASVVQMFKKLRPDYKKIETISGWFSDTLNDNDQSAIAFAHLDCDWYRPITECLEYIWPRMVVGGVVLIDDYYDWEGCRRAVHDFLSRNRAREAIRSVGQTGGAVIYRLGKWSLSESLHLA